MSQNENVILIPDGGAIVAPRPEFLVLALAVAAAAGRDYPSQATIGWISGMVAPYDGSDVYWSPYAEAGSVVYVRSWARGAYGYETRLTPGHPVERLDPSVWYTRLEQQIENTTVTDSVRSAVGVAIDQTTPGGSFGQSAIEHWTAVRNAQQKGELLTDSRKIKAACKRAGVLPL